MDSDFSESIKLLKSDRGITEDLVFETIEVFLMAAYKKKIWYIRQCRCPLF